MRCLPLNWINRFNKFLRNVRSEIRKVSWPTQSEVITMTILIIIMVILLSGYIGGVDIVYQRIIKQFLSL
ncbi:MAG: preprotein translocase subunit SecE [Candidatus Acetothermia bacterium]